MYQKVNTDMYDRWYNDSSQKMPILRISISKLCCFFMRNQFQMSNDIVMLYYNQFGIIKENTMSK